MNSKDEVQAVKEYVAEQQRLNVKYQQQRKEWRKLKKLPRPKWRGGGPNA